MSVDLSFISLQKQCNAISAPWTSVTFMTPGEDLVRELPLRTRMDKFKLEQQAGLLMTQVYVCHGVKRESMFYYYYYYF